MDFIQKSHLEFLSNSSSVVVKVWDSFSWWPAVARQPASVSSHCHRNAGRKTRSEDAKSREDVRAGRSTRREREAGRINRGRNDGETISE